MKNIGLINYHIFKVKIKTYEPIIISNVLIMIYILHISII